MIRARKYNAVATIELFNTEDVAIVLEEADEKRMPNFAQAEELLAEQFLRAGYYPDPVEALVGYLKAFGWEILSYEPYPEQPELPEGAVY